MRLRIHNPEVSGSNPLPATKETSTEVSFFILRRQLAEISIFAERGFASRKNCGVRLGFNPARYSSKTEIDLNVIRQRGVKTPPYGVLF